LSIVENLKYKQSKGLIDIAKLTKIIERAYESYNEPTFKQKTSFAPSKIGYGSGKCPRYWYIAFDGAEFDDKFTAQSIATMTNGTMAHERLGDLLKRSSLDVTLEEEFFHDDPPIHGFIDAIVMRGDDEVIGEIKTTRMEAFRVRQAKMEPPDYHLIQILIYMYLRKAESGFLLYENKNDHALLIVPVYMTDENTELVEYVLEWMREAKLRWERRELPMIPYRKNAKECKECPVQATCFDPEKYDEGDVKIEPLTL
jgi:CRISPR/Cas system-associated exonuclease Cas4 (RecB family)